MGVIVRLRNLRDMPCALKLPEMLMCFIVLVISRTGGHSADSGSLVSINNQWNVPWGGSIDSYNLGAMTTYGFFLIVLGQTVAYLCGERSMVQNGVINLAASACYVATGSTHISHFNTHQDELSDKKVAGEAYVALAKANGALAILTGLVWLIDAGYCIVQVIKD